MPTYFGYTTVGSFSGFYGAAWERNKGYVTGFTCPGTGQQIVKELSLYTRSAGGTPGHIRIAIYDAAHNLICQGTGKVTIDSTTAGWRGHLTQADMTPNPCNLTGGVQYDLAFDIDSADVAWYYNGGSAGDFTYGSADYIEGFPASLADGDDDNTRYSVRCGVDPNLLPLVSFGTLGGNCNPMMA